MRILQISSLDLTGQRFNGQYLIHYFNVRKHLGHICRQLVWKKDGSDPNTKEMVPFAFSRALEGFLEAVEDFFSLRCLLHPSTFFLPLDRFFKSADVVHYQLVYWPNFFSFLALPLLTRLKPSVWTFHDLFPITGHCVHPFGCERWLIGCGQCPDLNVNFLMRKDRTAFNWKVKKFIYQRSRFQIVVASKYMYDKVSRSPLTKGLPIAIVPFGIDLKKFSPGDKVNAKRLLGIDEDEIVISFRAVPGEFKGFEFVKQAIREIKTDKKICLLGFHVPHLLEEFRRQYKIVDLGWINDDEVTLAAYHATDFFLMPSVQEAFGMMAMEAMACGKPVVVFDGTALPETVGGGEIGIVVRQGDMKSFSAAVNRLIDDEVFREDRGRKGRAFAEENYSLDLHVQRLLNVYEETIARFGKFKAVRTKSVGGPVEGSAS